MSRSSGVCWHRKVIEYALHHGSSDSANPGLWVSPAASAANRRTVFISWEPPPLGFVKINFDGSVRGRCAGAAFVIRGAVGRMLARSSGVCWYRKEFEEPHRFLGIRRASPFPRNSKSLTISQEFEKPHRFQEFEEPHRFPGIRRASPFPKNSKSLTVSQEFEEPHRPDLRRFCGFRSLLLPCRWPTVVRFFRPVAMSTPSAECSLVVKRTVRSPGWLRHRPLLIGLLGLGSQCGSGLGSFDVCSPSRSVEMACWCFLSCYFVL